MRGTSPYSGILAEPIPHNVFQRAAHDHAREKQALPRMIFERLDALCRYYEVDLRDISEEPVLALARRYVPGFQISRGKRAGFGKPKKWDDVKLAQLWLSYQAVRPHFESDKAAVAYLARQKRLERITGKVELVWVKQLLEKARLSPLVQMMESDRPADRKFAQKFLATHDCE